MAKRAHKRTQKRRAHRGEEIAIELAHPSIGTHHGKPARYAGGQLAQKIPRHRIHGSSSA
jgi:hypothetical protein